MVSHIPYVQFVTYSENLELNSLRVGVPYVGRSLSSSALVPGVTIFINQDTVGFF